MKRNKTRKGIVFCPETGQIFARGNFWGCCAYIKYMREKHEDLFLCIMEV